MTDASGNKANFKNVILIMTGNFAMNEDGKLSMGFSESAKKDLFTEEQKRLISYCKEKYGVEFINRVDEFIPFMTLKDDDLRAIIKMRFEEICARLKDRNCRLEFTDGVYDLLLKIGKDEYGKNATVLNRLVGKKIEPCISDALMSSDKSFYVITIDIKDDEFIFRKKKEVNEKAQ
jgi:ATP-dependent Clp protease ATP-binding subunit ClpA